MASGGLVVNRQLVDKLQSVLIDSTYRETVENSASYNTRLAIEKRMRLPFLDAQTGVAQNHCHLWMQPRHRMPGLIPGQIYTYPAKRWRKKRRSYLATYTQTPVKKELPPMMIPEPEACMSAENSNAAIQSTNEDSKDSVPVISNKDEASKEPWYYEDIPAEVDDFEEPEADSDFDYEESYSSKKKPKKKPPVKTPSKGTRGRKKQIPVNYDATDTEKPYSCETCGARYKTRPGLTYHYTHSHKNLLDEEDDDAGGGAGAGSSSNSGSGGRSRSTRQGGAASLQSSMPAAPSPHHETRRKSSQPQQQQQQHHQQQLQQLHHHQQATAPPLLPPAPQLPPPLPPVPAPVVHSLYHMPLQQQQQPLPVAMPQPSTAYAAPIAAPAVREMEQKARAPPSPYCDFCLGDATENKKSGHAEELVSCADCGRSGHPTCLQFTTNMIISVKQYRWQCIECKCCSLCGNSDNDEQLLFCDDCDRGYHMYCLNPPLSEPPEGSWSCHLCLVIFHRK